MMTTGNYRFVALAGSLREASFTRAVAACLNELAPDDVVVEVFDELGSIPLYNQDCQDRGFPGMVEHLGSMITKADAVVIVSPEYNHSIPGVLKNALDWLSRLPEIPLAGKPTAIQTASPGLLGGARAHEQIHQVLSAMDALVLNKPEVIITQVGSMIDAASGLIGDQATRRQIAKQLVALAELTRRGALSSTIAA